MSRSKYKNKKYFLALLGVLFFFTSVWGIYSIFQNLPDPTRISQRTVAQTTKIYDRTGENILYEIHGEEKRTIISFSEIPDFIKKATLAAEDVHFYEHHGIDWRGIARAVITDLTQRSLSQGGSTITQQLIKKTLLGSEKTFKRKIREQILAVLLERKYTKDEILEMYLNQIPYGSNAYGIEAASQTYFNKSAKDLDLAESAALAALPQAPTRYSPFGSHSQDLLDRKNWILDRMNEAGFIDSQEKEEAKKEVLRFQAPSAGIKAPHFVMYVREYLNNKYGEDFVEQGGLKVVTTLDVKLQEGAEKIIKEGSEENKTNLKANNSALVAMDPRNGHILAMVGSKNYWGDPEPEGCTPGINCLFDPHFNVTTALRQPGSSFKPFIYATAFQKGYTPETVLFDVKTEFNPSCSSDGSQTFAPNVGDCYHPRNFDGKFRGPVTLRKSLGQSLNVPSVKLLYLAGIQDSIKTAQNMGITSLNSPERYGLSLVLGGAEVSLLELVSAYGVFSQDGILHPKTSIIRVENSQGGLLEEARGTSVPVLDTDVARIMNKLLSDNEARIPEFSPVSSLYFPDRQVAAKTGTTQEARDGWVIGYTPSLAVGVWSGNNNNESMNDRSFSVVVSGPMWHKFINFALQETVPENFNSPENNLSLKPVMRGFYRTGQTVSIDKITGKLATPDTPVNLIEETSFGTPMTILAQVNKNNPLGPVPENPNEDPQYKNWEYSVRNWVINNGLLSSFAPTEYDNVHTPENKPKIFFLTPEKDSVKKNLGQITIKTLSSFPIKDISLFIDDTQVDSKIYPGYPVNTFNLENPLTIGEYNIKVVVYDSVENKTTEEKRIKITP